MRLQSWQWLTAYTIPGILIAFSASVKGSVIEMKPDAHVPDDSMAVATAAATEALASPLFGSPVLVKVQHYSYMCHWIVHRHVRSHRLIAGTWLVTCS